MTALEWRSGCRLLVVMSSELARCPLDCFRGLVESTREAGRQHKAHSEGSAGGQECEKRGTWWMALRMSLALLKGGSGRPLRYECIFMAATIHAWYTFTLAAGAE